eukprot:1405279-Prymnesium_polylepis.1
MSSQAARPPLAQPGASRQRQSQRHPASAVCCCQDAWQNAPREQRWHAAVIASSSTTKQPGPMAASSCCWNDCGTTGGTARTSALRVATPTGSAPADLRPGVGSHGAQMDAGGSTPAARAAKRIAAIASLRAPMPTISWANGMQSVMKRSVYLGVDGDACESPSACCCAAMIALS